MAKSTMASKQIADDLSGISINFEDGEAVGVNLADLSDDIKLNLMLHGLSQKLGDTYAGVKDVVVAREKVKSVVARLFEGNWKAVRTAGAARITDLVNALADVTGKSIEEAFEAVDAMEKDTKRKLRAHPQIKLRLAQIAAERAEKAAASDEGTDIADLL